MIDNLEQKVALHKSFWAGEKMARPIYSISYGQDRMVANKTAVARSLLVHGRTITPEMLDVDAFVREELALWEDGELRSEALRYTSGDRISGIGAYSGVPWMEAIFGCRIEAMDASMVSHPCMEAPGDPAKIKIDYESNAWVEKYFEFLEKYRAAFGADRPVIETLLRGVSDTYGALVGQGNMIYALYDEPETVMECFDAISREYCGFVKKILSYTTPIAGGYAHPQGLWCPGTPNMFQEDLTSLMTPAHYRDMIKPLHDRMCGQFGTNVMHTHPTSYHIFDELIRVKNLSALQMQKDVGEVGVEHHIAMLKKVQGAGIPILFGAPLSLQELDLVLDAVELRGFSLHVWAENEQEASRLERRIQEWGRLG